MFSMHENPKSLRPPHVGTTALVLILVGALVSACDDEPSGGGEGDAGVDSGRLDLGDEVSNEDVSGGNDVVGRQTYTGDYTVSNQREMEFIGGFTSITGSLTVRAPLVTTLELRRLESIGADFRISGNDALTTVSLPSLTLVNGDLTITANEVLESLDGFVALERVGGDLRVSANPGVESMAWPALGSVGGAIVLGRDAQRAEPSVETVRLDALTEVGGSLEVVNNATLTTIEADALVEVGGLFVDANSVLDELVFPELTSIEGPLTVSDNAELTALELPSGSSLDGPFRVTGNGSLPECLVEALLGQFRVSDYRGEGVAADNDGRQGPCSALCGDVGGEDDRGRVCMEDGNFARVCRDSGCFERERLCQEDVERYGYNACVPSDQTTNDCSSGPVFRSSYRGGPLLFDSTFERDAERDADCDGVDEGTVAWVISFSYHETRSEARNPADDNVGRDNVEWIRAAIPAEVEGEDPITFEAMTSPFDLVFSDDADAQDGEISLWICLDDQPADVAVRTTDRDGRASNVLCAYAPEDLEDE